MHFELFSIMIYLHFFVYVESYFVQNKLIQNKHSDNNPNRWSNINVRHYSTRMNNFKFLKIFDIFKNRIDNSDDSFKSGDLSENSEKDATIDFNDDYDDSDVEFQGFSEEKYYWTKSWDDFDEEPAYFDEADSLDPDHEYYESKLTLTPPLTTEELHAKPEFTNKDITTLNNFNSNIINEIKMKSIDQVGSFPESIDQTYNLIKGWDDLSEDPPYYDDDHLIDEDFDTSFDRNYSSKVNENTFIRDSSGTQIGWADLNENDLSYFDESFSEKSYDDNLATQSLNEPNNLLIAMGGKKKNNKDSKNNIEIPAYEGRVVSEWQEWESDSYIGDDSDFGMEEYNI